MEDRKNEVKEINKGRKTSTVYKKNIKSDRQNKIMDFTNSQIGE